MTLLHFPSENRGNSRVPFLKQKDIVRTGLHLVYRIFRPSRYPSATFCTEEFRLNIPEETFDKMRGELNAIYKENQACAFEVCHKEATLVLPCDSFSIQWERNEYGINTKYDPDSPLFLPLNNATSTGTEGDENALPF